MVNAHHIKLPNWWTYPRQFLTRKYRFDGKKVKGSNIIIYNSNVSFTTVIDKPGWQVHVYLDSIDYTQLISIIFTDEFLISCSEYQPLTCRFQSVCTLWLVRSVVSLSDVARNKTSSAGKSLSANIPKPLSPACRISQFIIPFLFATMTSSSMLSKTVEAWSSITPAQVPCLSPWRNPCPHPWVSVKLRLSESSFIVPRPGRQLLSRLKCRMMKLRHWKRLAVKPGPPAPSSCSLLLLLPLLLLPHQRTQYIHTRLVFILRASFHTRLVFILRDRIYSIGRVLAQK